MEVVLERPVAVVQGRIIRVRIKDASLRISNCWYGLVHQGGQGQDHRRGQLYAPISRVPKGDGTVSGKGLVVLSSRPDFVLIIESFKSAWIVESLHLSTSTIEDPSFCPKNLI